MNALYNIDENDEENVEENYYDYDKNVENCYDENSMFYHDQQKIIITQIH
jgi:hypothetical protein